MALRISANIVLPRCLDSRQCFAKKKQNGKEYCTILVSTYWRKACPFCKEPKGEEE